MKTRTKTPANLNRASRLTTAAAILAAAALGFIPAVADAYTDPVGYETFSVPGGAFTLLGLRLHPSKVVYNTFPTVSGTVLTDPARDFETTLDPQRTYLVELTGDALDGRVLGITAFSGHTITVDEALPTASDVEYRIRPVPRLSEIIHPLEGLATDNFNPDQADLILIPRGGGRFDQFYVSSNIFHSGYFNAATGLPEDPLLWYSDAFYYLRRAASEFTLVVSGEVKMRSTLLQVTDTFNYFSSIYPVGLTLAESSLAEAVQAGTADTADIVWIEQDTGEYKRYFYSNGLPPLGVGWRQVDAPPGTANDDQGAAPFAPGFIIQRRAPQPYDALLTPPASYSNF